LRLALHLRSGLLILRLALVLRLTLILRLALILRLRLYGRNRLLILRLWIWLNDLCLRL
jgi:hypothetical protein